MKIVYSGISTKGSALIIAIAAIAILSFVMAYNLKVTEQSSKARLLNPERQQTQLAADALADRTISWLRLAIPAALEVASDNPLIQTAANPNAPIGRPDWLSAYDTRQTIEIRCRGQGSQQQPAGFVSGPDACTTQEDILPKIIEVTARVQSDNGSLATTTLVASIFQPRLSDYSSLVVGATQPVVYLGGSYGRTGVFFDGEAMQAQRDIFAEGNKPDPFLLFSAKNPLSFTNFETNLTSYWDSQNESECASPSSGCEGQAISYAGSVSTVNMNEFTVAAPTPDNFAQLFSSVVSQHIQADRSNHLYFGGSDTSSILSTTISLSASNGCQMIVEQQSLDYTYNVGTGGSEDDPKD